MTRDRFNFIWETAAIFFAIFAIWPWRLGWEPKALWYSVLAAALLLMVLVAVRRIRRMHRLRDEQSEQGPRPPGPFPPFLQE